MRAIRKSAKTPKATPERNKPQSCRDNYSEMTRKDDELKALLALGILASLSIVIELVQFTSLLNIPGTPSHLIVFLEGFMEKAILVLFGLYVASLTASLGFEGTWGERNLGARAFRWIGEDAFMFGAIILFFTMGVFFLRVFFPWVGS